MRKLVGTITVALLVLFSSAAYAAHDEGPGLVQAPLITQTLNRIGILSIWNTGDKFQLRLDGVDSWQIKTIHIYVGNDPVPASRKGNLVPGRFNYKDPYRNSEGSNVLVLDLEDDMDFYWGDPYSDLRVQNIAVHVTGERLDENGNVIAAASAWAYTGEGADTEFGDIDEESLDALEFEGVGKGWWFSYMLSHPSRGHFIDSPVGGLSFQTPTHSNLTDEAGAFDFFPGESVTLSIGNYPIGTTVADHKVSPLDFYPLADVEDENVTNMARLLQSFDSNAYPRDGITLSVDVVKALETAMGTLGYTSLNFDSTEEIDAIIAETIAQATLLGLDLVEVYAEDAQIHLAESVNNSMFRKNISKTPDLASSKAKMNIATVWLPAMKANGDPVTIEYFDEDGNLIRTAEEAKPVIVTYTDADPVTGEHDVYAAVSRDDGATWKRKNLSRSADRSSFTLANDQPYYGGCKKPVFQVKGNKILVAWSSKFARGGKPRYAIEVDDPATEEVEDDYIFDDPYYVNDIWGVGGPQRSHDYTEEGFPEVGEVPHAALWVCRGLILTQKDLGTVVNADGSTWSSLGYRLGDIVWFKPERVTSGRRDVNQIFVAAAGSAGFAMVWQEDPNGVKPGRAVGPGPGWGGATTSHKTDIWYSYLAWGDHSKVDTNFVIGGDPGHDVDAADAADTTDTSTLSRPKALAPLSLPVRLSDNEVVNTDNLLVQLDDSGGYPTTTNSDNPMGYTPLPNPDASSDDADGTHAYAYTIPGLIDVNNVSEAPADINQNGFYTFDNYDDETKRVAITEDGRLLDGDTGASRGNIFLQPYVAGHKPDGSEIYSAWAIITYEETKGAGAGPPEETGTGENSDAYIPEEGKNVIYHSFDFKTPDLVSAGYIMNSPEMDIDGNLIYLTEEPAEDGTPGAQIFDYLGRPQLAYENARRGRFILQGAGAIKKSRSIMLMVYKEGEEGSGRPSDIMMQRWVVPSTDILNAYTDSEGTLVPADNPYRFENIVGDWIQDAVSEQYYRASGPVNMSSVTPTVTTASAGDPEVEDAYGAVKVVQWEQTVANLDDPSWLNPYDDARAHRGQIRGDFVQLGFSYTPNWAASRNGNDKYDFFIRRSFDGGANWTTLPAAQGGEGVEHCQLFKSVDGDGNLIKEQSEEVCTTYDAGDFEVMRNLTQLLNAKSSVIEPRIVAVPGTIKSGGFWTGIPEDKQNPAVFYVAWGTSTNPKKDPVTGEQEEPVPQDLFWSVSNDKGKNYYLQEWEVNPDSSSELAGETVYRTPWMAKGDQEQGEVQLRMTPDGSRFYASWLDEGDDGSDIVFRRIMPNIFSANVATGTVITEPIIEEEVDSADNTSDDGNAED